MSKNLFVFLVLFLISPILLFAKVTISESSNSTIYDFQIEGANLNKVVVANHPFVQATLNGVKDYLGITFQEGLPEIPVIRLLVTANDEKDIEVTFDKDMENNMVKLIAPIMPNQPSSPKIKNFQVPFVQNLSFYQKKSFWPAIDYQVDNAGSVRGKALKLVTLYPFSYNPATRQYKLRNHIRVEVLKSEQQQQVQESSAEMITFIIGNQYANSESLLKYIDFKKQLGFIVTKIVIGVDAVTPNDVRAKLQELYRSSNHALKYALIVGDIEDVPSPRANNLTTGVTDHFYRAIDTNDYESDINGPDIGVGRITVKNELELSNVIDKFIRYQKGDFVKTDWLTHLSFLATDDRYTIAEGSHNYAINTYTAGKGYTGVFPRAAMAGGDQLYAITHHATNQQVVTTMKLGRFIINYSGHGSKTSWAGPSVTQTDVRSFTDTSFMPFVISNACITGQFNIDESFGETWIKHPAGAIMFWGSMDSSYWDEDDVLERSMFDAIYTNQYRTFAKITNYSLGEVWKRYGGEGKSKYYWESYVTFGDPSIQLRTWVPRVVNIEGPEVIPYGLASINYNLTDSAGKPVVGAQVSLKKINGNSIYTSITDASGAVKLDLADATVGDKLLVTVTGADLKLSQKTISVVSADRPFLMLNNFTLNGAAERLLAPFEKVTIGFNIKNLSYVALTGAKIKLESVDGPIAILANEISIGALNGNSQVTYNGDDIAIVVNNAQLSDIATLNFRWTTVEGQSGMIVKKFNIARGAIAVSLVDFGGGNGIAAGAEGDIYLTLKNVGNAPLHQLSVTAATDNCLDEIQGSMQVEELLPGMTVRLFEPLNVLVSANCKNGNVAKFKLAGDYQGEFASIDLNAFGSFIVGKTGNITYLAEGINLPLNDMNSTTYSFQFNNQVDLLNNMAIHLKIDHTYIGDITINLINPQGVVATLRKREGGSGDVIDETYGVGGILVPDLQKFTNLPTAGTWKLEIIDDARNDVGTLKSVKVDVQGYL